MLIRSQILLLFCVILFSVKVSAEPFKFIYEKSKLAKSNEFGYTAPIYCVNDNGSIITVSNGGYILGLGCIYRNGEINWNREIIGVDEFDPSKPPKIYDVQNVYYDGYANHFAGSYRNKALFEGSAFFYFLATGGYIQNFSYDTTKSKGIPRYNLINYFNFLLDKKLYVLTSLEYFLSESNVGSYKYYMSMYDDSGKYIKSTDYDTLPELIRPLGVNIYFRYNTIMNLTFYNNSTLGDSKRKPKINYFDRNLNLVKSITLPFTELPDDITFESVNYISNNDSTKLRFFATSKMPKKDIIFFEIDPQNKTVYSKIFKYYKRFTACKALYDKDGNIILAGMADRDPLITYGTQAFTILKFDASFNLKDSLIWERGDNSIMMGFDKYGDDEFIVTGYYIDKENYSYGYTARLNSNPSGIEEVKEEGISIKQYDEQLYIESQYTGLDIQICDVLGKVYLTKKTDQQTTFVELENIPSGFYIVSVSSGTSRRVYKIIK